MKKKPTTAAALSKAAKAKGLEFQSKGVNAAALSGISGHTTNLKGTGVHAATVSWQRLPPEFLETCSELEWQTLIKSFAEYHGWTCYHTLNSQGSDAGFPDLVMCRSGRLYFAELKKDGGVSTKDQDKWGKLLSTIDGSTQVRHYLWFPRHWDYVQKILSETSED